MCIDSSFHFQIKADVETQGEFVKSLIKEVTDAAYKDIEDVVAFVKWLDDELGFLVRIFLSLPFCEQSFQLQQSLKLLIPFNCIT
jgi:hypothetical protein